jgi:iron uptake system component EfeO
MIAAGAMFYFASREAKLHAPAHDDALTVTINDKTCTPNAITVAAGAHTFRIVNQSKRAVEWEILDGVMVVEERENIAPGFTQMLTARLEPGDYAITCGLLSNPRGTLHVTPSAAGTAEAARPSTAAYVGALAEYRVYLTLEANALARDAGAFVAAVKAGDLARAKSLYAPARLAYTHLAPAADLFSDLDVRLDARADYFETRENDPAFTGFHRLEYGLFQKQSTDGLASVADQLLADIATLQSRMRTLAVPPARLARGAARVMHAIADNKLTGEEDRYSHTDLSTLSGDVQGVGKIIDLLHPLLAKADPTSATTLDAQLKSVNDALAQHRSGDGFVSFDTLSAADRASVGAPITALAKSLDSVNATLGLN